MPLPISVRRLLSSLVRPAPKRRPSSRRLTLRTLEDRVVPDFGPVGPEFRANTYTDDSQGFEAVAMDADGDFVVVWESYIDNVIKYEIRAQQYNSAGVAQGPEFPVNTTTASTQDTPAVAMDAAGNFVVTWKSIDQDGDEGGIFARRFNAAGVPLSGEFQVNTYTTNGQYVPAIAMNPAGAFVIAWESTDQADIVDIYAQLFTADGLPVGSEIPVNQTTLNVQDNPYVAMDAAGNFVVTWTGEDETRLDWDVFGRRFNAAGVPLGDEFRVNTTTAGLHSGGAVAADADGNFVIAWSNWTQGAEDGDVLAQRFSAAGVPQGGEFRANATVAGDQGAASVAMDPAGRFLITWSSDGQDGSDYGVYAQRFGPTGTPLGTELQVNTYTTDRQGWNAPVAVSADGRAIIAWSSWLQDGSGSGVYAQRFGDNQAPELFDVPGEATTDELAPYSFTATATDPDDDSARLRFSLINPPTGASIDPVTGVFKWTPTEAQGPGTFTFAVRVADRVNTTDAPITLTVREVNVPPTLEDVPATPTAVPGATLTFTVTATDPDLVNGQPNTLTFSLVGAPAGAAIDPATGAFSWTPVGDVTPGDYPFQVRVADDGTPLGADTKPVTVRVARAWVVGRDLAVAGTTGNDIITVLPDVNPSNVVVRVNGTQAGVFPLSQMDGRVVVHGFEGNDRVTVGATVSIGADLWGGDGKDTLTGGAGADVLSGEAGNDRLVGGRGNDRYEFADSWGVDAVVETSTGGMDTLDLSGATFDLTISVAGSVRAVAAANAVAGSNLDNLLAGSGNDRFKFAAGGKLRGTIDGGPGTNALNYAAYLTAVTVNLGLGTATGTAGVANIVHVIGGAGSDTLVGNAQANTLTGNGGRDILIGASGADALIGGGGDDLLLGSSTTHAADPTALTALRREWVRPISYANRIAHLRGTLGAGLNGSTLLDATSVQDDGGAVDVMTGGLGLDWFLTFAGDANDATPGETVTTF